VAPWVIPDYLKNVFAKFGSVKGICTEVQQTLGLVFVAFFDVRHARLAYNALSTGESRMMGVHLPAKPGAYKVEVSFVSPEEMATVRQSVLTKSLKLIFPQFASVQAVAEVSGKVIVKITESLAPMDATMIKDQLTSIGDLRDFNGDEEQVKHHYCS
jgi:hypothetical protein